MSLAVIHSRAMVGMQALAVAVEVHISGGLPHLSIVGLPETAVRESKDRVRSALINSRFEFPNRNLTINLAPADLPKEGSCFDLPIALGILAASRQIPLRDLNQYEFAGELGLTGELRSLRSILPFAIASRNAGRQLIIPFDNAAEAGVVRDVDIFPADHLLEICAHLTGKSYLSKYIPQEINVSEDNGVDFSDVYCQQQAKRALEIAASGGHSVLMSGPPGVGKTMLAERLTTILPKMTEEEALECAMINSIGGKKFCYKNWRKKPFRRPHHTASSVALVGGGRSPKPGEISLAHNGVLFLDELPEFGRQALETLREPLESGNITISRAAYQQEFPAKFQLIAAINPCPCGYWGSSRGNCRCTPAQIKQYHTRLSGPLLDRIDLHLEVSSLSQTELQYGSQQSCENSATIRKRVVSSREQQYQRNNGVLNVRLYAKALNSICCLKASDQAYLCRALERLGVSARGKDRLLRVARTIADLDGSKIIERNHLQEALNYRLKLRFGF